MTRRTWWLPGLAIALLALAASGNSITNGFTYDDIYVIQKPVERMSSLAGWWTEFAATYWPSYGVGPGDGYRPLTILAFKVQYILGGAQPLAFHATSIALHAVTSVAVFWLACTVLPLAPAWIAAALYAVHPVHVEAIANVVGQSELAVALLVTLAMALFISGRRRGPVSPWRWMAIGVLYAAAMMFKENGITLIALVPLAELTVVADRAPLRERLLRLRAPMLGLLAVAMAYLWARGLVIEGTGFNPYEVFHGLDLSTRDRVLTMIGASPEWLRLFLWPARLMTEYSPAYITVAQGFGVQQIPGLLLLLGTLGLAAATWQRSPVTSFGIGWIVITLLPASNFIVPAGFIIAERTLLVPSVGAMLAVASVVPWLYERFAERRWWSPALTAAVAVLLALGVARSVDRNPDWHDNETLMRQGVLDSPDSYRAHYMLGALLFEQLHLTEGEVHFRKALELFPYDSFMTWALAERYRSAGFCTPAIPLYEWSLKLRQDAPLAHMGYAECLLEAQRPREARAQAMEALRQGAPLLRARALIRSTRAPRESQPAE